MDALTLLQEVSEAYGSLETLEVEAALIQKSGDENAGQRSERRVRFFFAAPDRMRFEPCGNRGTVQVTDGKQLHTTHLGDRHRGGLRYTSVPVAEMGRTRHILHRFQPEFPFAGEAFLFPGIQEQVVSAEILREEDGCHVVSVTYQPRPNPGLIVTGSAITFWIDGRNRMVMRQRSATGHRVPTEDEVTWSRHEQVVRGVRINQQIPEETFHFTPPAGAKLDKGEHGGGVGWGVGRGFVYQDPDEKRRYESHFSCAWEGDTLVDRCKLKLRGMLLAFERRLTFSDDGKELRVAERIAGPKGELETSCRLPVA